MCDSTDRRRVHRQTGASGGPDLSSRDCLCDCAVIEGLKHPSGLRGVKVQEADNILPFPVRPHS
jgi:hypothetical protein